MSLIESLGLAALHRLDPERAQGLSLRALSAGLVPLSGVVTSSRLATRVAGLDLPNPVGLAAGFDKNATAIAPLSRSTIPKGCRELTAEDGFPIVDYARVILLRNPRGTSPAMEGLAAMLREAFAPLGVQAGR